MTIEEDPLFLTGYSSVIVRLRAGDGSTVIAKHAIINHMQNTILAKLNIICLLLCGSHKMSYVDKQFAKKVRNKIKMFLQIR